MPTKYSDRLSGPVSQTELPRLDDVDPTVTARSLAYLADLVGLTNFLGFGREGLGVSGVRLLGGRFDS